MAHTPGPWRFEQDGHEPYWNVDMPMQDGSPGYGYANAMVYTTEADARLIAAAPELLAALHDIITCAHVNTPYGGKAYCISDGRMDAARAAINKAEGRSE